MELDEKVYEEILSLCSKGDDMVENGDYDSAINLYDKALEFVPDSKSEWEASTWIYTALGDVFFIKEDHEMAKHYFYEALNCPDGLENSFILLRLGQCLYECEEIEKAKEYLLKAYMLEGNEIFEEEDEKYFNSIINII